MADKNNSIVHAWEPSTTIELLALLLTIPGAMAAIATFYVLITRHRQKKLSTSLSIPWYKCTLHSYLSREVEAVEYCLTDRLLSHER
jgi:hypothetical protein